MDKAKQVAEKSWSASNERDYYAIKFKDVVTCIWQIPWNRSIGSSILTSCLQCNTKSK